MFQIIIRNKLEKLVRQYFQKHPEVKLVAVVGAVGKTTTKNAIATVLSKKFRVRMENGNHNTQLSVPPALLGVKYPEGHVHSPLAWLRVFGAMKKRIKAESDVDVIVQELGTDHNGEIPHFGKYLRPDIAVVTSVAPEHMEYFKTIEAVAKEELSVTSYSATTLINRDDTDEQFAEFILSDKINTYGIHEPAEYRFETVGEQDVLKGFSGQFISPELGDVPAVVSLIGQHNLKAGIAAGAVGAKLGMSAAEISDGMDEIHTVPGRMNVLRGRAGTTIIDDTYNSGPSAAIAALKTLYQIKAPLKFAILGSMNELGETSESAHAAVGDYCNPEEIEYVITIGEEAEKYLVPAAKTKGNRVASFRSPIGAGAFLNKRLQKGAVILAKGSQNGVFAEEAIKMLLHSTVEEDQLVRQTPYWLNLKAKLYDNQK
ncbi:MAG: UDP-N-acetylmuramoyl-tripeptide--D-alanyl-D-alanine ligase [Candidatus Nomurabacteria bacterium]|jgi:UDP-N-acetylmuramoyl-tripeptide--D-alanyl-D-alanine ligase|nr:UDP-N-acetylmuramoyl-tripeptide--D-alanyl-D-alanine ligase [Candidatus Nomurabacteria bacterium]